MQGVYAAAADGTPEERPVGRSAPFVDRPCVDRPCVGGTASAWTALSGRGGSLRPARVSLPLSPWTSGRVGVEVGVGVGGEWGRTI